MTYEGAEAICATVRLGHTFELWRLDVLMDRVPDAVRFTVRYWGIDTTAPKQSAARSIPIYTAILMSRPELELYDERRFTSWLEMNIHAVVRHEVMECLSIRGRQLKDPHEAERKALNARSPGQRAALR